MRFILLLGISYNRCVSEKLFNVSDKVRVYNLRRFKNHTAKWLLFYKDVVTVICHNMKLNDVTYLLQCPSWRENKVVHIHKLKSDLSFPNG